MLGPFSQSLYSTVLDEKSNNLLPFLFRCAALSPVHINRTTTVLQSQNGNFLYRCIEFNVPRTNINIKIAMVKNHKHSTGRPDQLYPRVFALRPNRALLVLASFKRMMGEKILALRLRTSATWSASRTRSFADKFHL